ncbi:PepSY domain-containing protein [Rhodoferax sp.]|uniref:PepSY domain-containing protein n=1 Tax=Rhodoferax sp. TaxID=50421 RepID=UPI00274F34CE|nr:PepSY domain-containing protein [Rhodoferax sp.]
MKHSMRNWHTWGSVALGVPLLLVGLTNFFIAHQKSLGTKEIVLPIGGNAGPAVEIRASARIGNEQWLGTMQGVFRIEDDTATPLQGSPSDEIRDLVSADGAVLLAGKRALWRYEGGRATQVYKADCWQIAVSPTGYTAACKDEGLLTSTDGMAWRALAVRFPSNSAHGANAKEAGIPLSKFIMDLHTGKLFFGKQYEWIWIDLLGLACVGLGLTGLVMWMRARRQRAQVQG